MFPAAWIAQYQEGAQERVLDPLKEINPNSKKIMPHHRAVHAATHRACKRTNRATSQKTKTRADRNTHSKTLASTTVGTNDAFNLFDF